MTGLLALAALGGCAPPPVVSPAHPGGALPAEPWVLPLPDELNLFRLDAAPLRALIKDPEAFDRGALLAQLAARNPGLKAMLDHCGKG